MQILFVNFYELSCNFRDRLTFISKFIVSFASLLIGQPGNRGAPERKVGGLQHAALPPDVPETQRT